MRGDVPPPEENTDLPDFTLEIAHLLLRGGGEPQSPEAPHSKTNMERGEYQVRENRMEKSRQRTDPIRG